MAARHTLPVFLEGYPVFDKLAEWTAAGAPGEDRYWSMGSKPGPFRCTLCWFSGGRLWWVERFSPNPEEAVHLALDEFARTQGRA